MTPLDKIPTPITDALCAKQPFTSDMDDHACDLERKLALCREALEKFASVFTDRAGRWSGTEYAQPADVFSCWQLAKEAISETKP